jgi:hypothetical protein
MNYFENTGERGKHLGSSQRFSLPLDVWRPGDSLTLISVLIFAASSAQRGWTSVERLTSDYQDPLPDSAGHGQTVSLVSAGISRRYVWSWTLVVVEVGKG